VRRPLEGHPRPLLTLALAATLVVLTASPAPAAGTQDQLRSRWLGAWVILTSGLTSDCSGMHTNNRIHGELSLGRGMRRFEPGELGQVTKVDLKRARVDVFVKLREEVLIAYEDGPFELYREAQCRIELLVDVPRQSVKAKDVATIDALILNVVERYPSLDEARDSGDWNGREREAYPEDYARRVAEHKVWMAEQRNAAVEEKIERSMELAQDVLSRVSHEREGYGEAFTQGVETMTGREFDHCDRMLASTFDSWKQKVPEDVHEEGYYDGQQLAYGLRIARSLERCYVDVPELDWVAGVPTNPGES
jgi:hypothetical protein